MTECASCGAENRAGARFCDACGSLLDGAAVREMRKTVTVVFCDITGSTELGESTDPEALRALLARYFDRMKGIIESHGGSVEKFIGDAVMAVFGVPVAHEDDALRAGRAAVEMRDALPELGVAGRIGVNTGEVVTGTEERLATGDAVNVAARLEQAAQPGEVLVGADTLRLVQAAVEVGEERSLELKGKAAPVLAYPLLAVTGGLERRFATPMVGRERELIRLRVAFDQAIHDRSCQLFTILGSAGVGKSRIAAEFFAGLEAGVVRGRCLSYGEGITYWPVVEVLKQLDALPEGDAARPLRSLLGETDEAASAEEIAWAFRKLLEQEAQERSLVVVFDDLHWAEETLLDLVEHVADLSRDAPLLLLCMARPELLERRPSWGGGKWNATAVLLEPLDAAETDQLLLKLGGVAQDLRERIVAVAEGNPLFLEEMLALVRDTGGEVEVPPTIQALLAARLDQLDPAERSVLERGSVEGRTFHRGSVAALAEGDGEIDQRLVALVRKELVRPDRAQLAGDDAYRFRHLLIRDAAYDALPKASRAELHRRFAAWLELHGQSLVELDEILGYHLGQAHRYRLELGLGGEETDELGRRASARLAAAGERAVLREDTAGARTLLDRACALLPAGERPLELDLLRVHARFDAGDLTEALAVADELVARSRDKGDRPGELRALLARSFVAHLAEASEGSEPRRLVDEAIAVFQERGDDAGLADAWLLASENELSALRWRACALALEQAVAHGKRSNNRIAHRTEGRQFAPYAYGPFPVEEGLAFFEAHPSATSFHAAFRGQLEAMRGNAVGARQAIRGARERAGELGQRLSAAGHLMQEAEIELHAGDAARAADVALEGVAALEALGERGWLSTVAGHGAEAFYRLGRDEEAWRLTDTAEEAGATDDVITQMLIRQVRGKVLARRGKHEAAERLVREAIEWGEPTDALEYKANAFRDLAIVLGAAGRRDEALAALADAQALYEKKGHTVGVARTEELRAEVTASPA